MSVSIACSPAGLDLLRSRWERLYSPELHTIFQTFAWNRLAAAVFGDREPPYVVYAENSTGAALIPAAIVGHRISFLGETLFDYRDILAVGDGRALRAAWQELARLRLPLRVAAVRGGGNRWSGFDLKPFSQAPCVRRDDVEQFAAHSRAGRLVRRLERKGAELKRYDGSVANCCAKSIIEKPRNPATTCLPTPAAWSLSCRRWRSHPRSLTFSPSKLRML